MIKKYFIILLILVLLMPVVSIYIYNSLIQNRFSSLRSIISQNSNKINDNINRLGTLENQKLHCDVISMEEGFRGSNFCISKGYDICLQVHKYQIQQLYVSTDSTCIGLQDRETKILPLDCDSVAQVFYNDGDCSYYNAGGVNGQEPIQGDSSIIESFKAICCNKI